MTPQANLRTEANVLLYWHEKPNLPQSTYPTTPFGFAFTRDETRHPSSVRRGICSDCADHPPTFAGRSGGATPFHEMAGAASDRFDFATSRSPLGQFFYALYRGLATDAPHLGTRRLERPHGFFRTLKDGAGNLAEKALPAMGVPSFAQTRRQNSLAGVVVRPGNCHAGGLSALFLVLVRDAGTRRQEPLTRKFFPWLAGCGLFLANQVAAQTPATANATRCIEPAAAYHRVNAEVLRAILKVESSFRPDAIGKNRNGTVDVGIAQINSMHFPKLRQFDIHPNQLLDPCVGTYVAAWHLAKQIAAYGNTWFAIGAYHSVTPVHNSRYQGLIYKAVVQLRERPQSSDRQKTISAGTSIEIPAQPIQDGRIVVAEGGGQ